MGIARLFGRTLGGVQTLRVCAMCDAPLRDDEWDCHVLSCVVISVGSQDGSMAGQRELYANGEAMQYEKLRREMLQRQKVDGWKDRFGTSGYDGSRGDIEGGDPLGPPWDTGGDDTPPWGWPYGGPRR